MSSSSISLQTTEKLRNQFMLGSIVLAVIMLVTFSTILPGIAGGYYWSLSLSALYLGFALLKRDTVFLKIIIFSYAAGIAELAADYWLVESTKSLVYPTNQLMIFSSPSYMPLAWSVVLIQLGYISGLFLKKFSIVTTGFIMVVMGALFIPTYEHWAINAGWWKYVNTPMILNEVPHYIIVAEGILMFSIPAIYYYTTKASWTKVVLLGALQGLIMWLSCLIAWGLVG